MPRTPEERKQDIREAQARWQRTERGKGKLSQYQKKYRIFNLEDPERRSKKEVKEWLEKDNGLDVPLISPHLIPPSFIQEWHEKTYSYRIIRRGYPRGKSTIDV